MDTTPPGEVTDLTAAELDGAVYLRWTNPADGTAAKATMDQLRVYMLDDGEYQLVNYKLDSPANNKEGLTGLMYVDGLTNGTAYTFKVTATDKWGNESEGVTIAATPRAGFFSITDLRLENINFRIVAGSRMQGTNYGLLAGTVQEGAALTNVTITGSIEIGKDCYRPGDYNIGLLCGSGKVEGIDMSGITVTAEDPDNNTARVEVNPETGEVTLTFAE